jgi:hypothetical protein
LLLWTSHLSKTRLPERDPQLLLVFGKSTTQRRNRDESLVLENAAKVNNTENAPNESKSRRRIGLKWDKNRNKKKGLREKRRGRQRCEARGKEAREIVATDMRRFAPETRVIPFFTQGSEDPRATR